MRWLTGAIAWIYDFLAEDLIVLIGTGIALAVAAIAVHAVRNEAGVILFAFVVLVIAVSIARTATAKG